jgi:anti-sigma factor (TIGR02949 family)
MSSSSDQPGCDQMPVQLDPYLDDELAPAERARVEAHLATCERCAAALRYQWRARAAMVRQRGAERAPESLQARVRRLLRGGPPDDR